MGQFFYIDKEYFVMPPYSTCSRNVTAFASLSRAARSSIKEMWKLERRLRSYVPALGSGSRVCRRVMDVPLMRKLNSESIVLYVRKFWESYFLPIQIGRPQSSARFFLGHPAHIYRHGRTQGEGPGDRALPLGHKKHYIFSVSSVKLRDFRPCYVCSNAFCDVKGPRKPVAW